jgi:hypothetical protein
VPPETAQERNLQAEKAHKGQRAATKHTKAQFVNTAPKSNNKQATKGKVKHKSPRPIS